MSYAALFDTTITNLTCTCGTLICRCCCCRRCCCLDVCFGKNDKGTSEAGDSRSLWWEDETDLNSETAQFGSLPPTQIGLGVNSPAPIPRVPALLTRSSCIHNINHRDDNIADRIPHQHVLRESSALRWQSAIRRPKGRYRKTLRREPCRHVCTERSPNSLGSTCSKSHRVSSNKVDISIDPETGRNPSYCFVEFKTQEDATNAMNSLQGINLQGRALRINPKTDRKPNPTAERTARGWGPRATDGNENSYPNNRWKREDAQPQWNAPAEDPKRVYVGSLHASDQETINAEMKGLFEGYEVTSVSKLITPQSALPDQNSSFCFVEVATPAQAVEAVRNLNGRPTPHGDIYRVSHAKGKRGPTTGEREPWKSQQVETSKVFISGLPQIASQEELDHQIRELFAGLQINEISKLITPHESKQTESGNHHYCFATFDRQEEAQRGVEAMNGQPTPNGGIYKISFARERPAGNFGQADRFQQREGGYQSRGGFQQRDGFQQREGGQDSPRRQQREQPQGPPVNRDFGSSWRRRD